MLYLLQDFLTSYPLYNSPFLRLKGFCHPVKKNYGAIFKILPDKKQKVMISKNGNASRLVFNDS